jgi:Cdc6-like AAA superfamily ATPase
MAAQLESKRQSSTSSSDDLPTPNDSRPVSDDPARSVPPYLLWFAASLVLALAGGWGVIAGWYLGLPGGGEIRQNVLSDQPFTLRDLFVAIPHPDLAELPFVPKPGGDGFQVREKFRSALAWKEGSLPIQSPLPTQPSSSQLSKQQFSKEQFGREPSNTSAAQSGPPPILPSGPISFFTTNIGSVGMVLELQQPTLNSGTCLTIKSQDQIRSACVALPADMPANTPMVSSVEALDKNALPSFFFPALRLLNGGVFSDQPGPASGIFLSEFAGQGANPYALISSATLGTEVSGTASIDRPTIWVGGLLGNIFKISPDPAGSAVSITRLNVPFGGTIKFVGFVSQERGWIWTSAGERGISPPAAAQTFDGGASWQRLSYRWLPAPWVFVAFMLGAIAFERGTTARIRLTPVATEKYIADHGVSDDPIGLSDEDALGLMPIARSMARFLRNTETKPTVAIAVTGPWGSGKTSLMNLVKEELNQRDVRTAWFNAWHNQKEENLLAALLASIRTQAVPPPWTVSGFIYRLRVAWMRIGADPNATIAWIVFALAAFAIVATHLDAAARILSQIADRIGSLLPVPPGSTAQPLPAAASGGTPGAASAITSIGLSTGGITAIIFAGKKLWDLFKPLKSIPADLLSTLSGQSSTRDIDQQLSFRYRFASEFAIFCDTLRRPPHPGLVIFIDDLDRCAPKQTVDILEAINFVTSAGRCFVVLGLDENKVKAAIADSYKDMTLRLDTPDPSKPLAQTPGQLQQQKLAELNDFASHYLEKLIHLVVPVPRSREDSVELLLGLKPSTRKDAETPKWRKAAKVGFEMLGTMFVVAFLISSAWLGLDLATRSLPTVAASSAAPTNAPAADSSKRAVPPSGLGTESAATLRPAPAGPPLTSADLADAGLTTRGVLGTVPPVAVVLAFALLLIIVSFQFLPRLQIEPVVSDGPQFQEALRVWLEGITKTRETPRAVKRFVNRLRFMAMRLRDLSTEAKKDGRDPPLDEADLVAMAVIGDLDQECLGKTDDELRKRQKAGDGRGEDVAIILSSLKDFREQFGRDPYDNEVALPTFRLLAGLVVEGQGETGSEGGLRKREPTQ